MTVKLNRAGTSREQIAQMHRDLMRRQHDELDAFRFQYNPPGVRYWEMYSTTSLKKRVWHTTGPGEVFFEPDGWRAAEVNHLEAVTRRTAWLKEQDDLLPKAIAPWTDEDDDEL